MEFQIKLTDKKGHGSFLYFKSDENEKEMVACETANEYLRKQREKDEALINTFFHTPYKAFKTINVVEYDNVNHCTKRGGLKFKLNLSYVEFKLKSGVKIRNEWYESTITV